ncbi:MAG TPA: hypothetical protein VLJ88_01555 [Propionibacteriaceae bacterium]|nr:hypothetical protein [Propionibacteriaceae bacterium]
MDTSWASLSQRALVSELDNIERAIARTRAFHTYTDGTGRTRARVSPELLALAEQEHLIISELRRR